MPSKSKKPQARPLAPVPDVDLVTLMSADQAALLRQLAQKAFEPDAFSTSLTQAEAAKRIAMLEAKLKLQGEPPHTL